jgi:hypothetical protein
MGVTTHTSVEIVLILGLRKDSPDDYLPLILLNVCTIFYGTVSGEGWYWGLSLRLCACKVGALLLQPQLQFIFLIVFEMESCDLFAHAGLKLQSSQPC